MSKSRWERHRECLAGFRSHGLLNAVSCDLASRQSVVRTWIYPASILSGFVVWELEVWVCGLCSAVWVVGGVEGSRIVELHVGSGAGDEEPEASKGSNELHAETLWCPLMPIEVLFRGFRSLVAWYVRLPESRV